MIYPIPTIDHVVINVRDRIDAGAETFGRLGFTLTPRGYHTLGSMNHLAMFGTDYLELIAAESGNTKRPEILTTPQGLNGLVFATEDARATHAQLVRAGLPVFVPGTFSRPVVFPHGSLDAVFRTVRLRPGVFPAGRLYFCEHQTRHLVWRDEWRHHPNGVTGVARAVVVDEDPSASALVFQKMFGPDSVRPIADGMRLTTGVSCFDVITPTALMAEFGATAPDAGGRASFMAVLEFRVTSLDKTWAALHAGGISAARDARRVLVSAEQAFGATLAFTE